MCLLNYAFKFQKFYFKTTENFKKICIHNYKMKKALFFPKYKNAPKNFCFLRNEKYKFQIY